MCGLVALVAGWLGLTSRDASPSKSELAYVKAETHYNEAPKVGQVSVLASLKPHEEENGLTVVKYLVPATEVVPGASYFKVDNGRLREVKGGENNCPPSCYTLQNDCNPPPCKYEVVITEGGAITGEDSCPPSCAFSVLDTCPPSCATGLPTSCPPNCMYETKEAK